MANNSSMLFDTVDGWVYNEAYDKANSNTVSSSKALNTVDRLKYAQSGHVLNSSQNAAIEQDSRNIDIINSLSNSDRSALYFGYKENITRPMYGKGSNSTASNDETYFNYLKGYVGSFLYSPYSWYSTDSDVGFGEFLALQAGNAVYQFGDALLGDDSFNDALTDWWEQAKGPYDALSGELVVRDELKGKFLKVHLSDANIYVYVGIGLDGQFKVLADTDIKTKYINSDTYEAPQISVSLPTSLFVWCQLGTDGSIIANFTQYNRTTGGGMANISTQVHCGIPSWDVLAYGETKSISSSSELEFGGSFNGTISSDDSGHITYNGTISWPDQGDSLWNTGINNIDGYPDYQCATLSSGSTSVTFGYTDISGSASITWSDCVD